MEGAKQQIRAAFDIFDKEKTGCIIQEEVSSVMRYLNVYPSERDIVKRILPEMQGEESSTFVTYPKLEQVVLQAMEGKEYPPDTDDTLLAAFQVLDPKKLGYIDADVMEEALATKGTPFREKEVKGFMDVAKDLETGRVYYEDYIAIMTESQSI